MADRSHLSIGEVLALLQDQFPDMTISKIRFLETQGLISPERTPSGYRKFFENDIERLRWILHQQRENFLPLKVIKERLAAGELDDMTPGTESNDSGGQLDSLDKGQTAVSMSIDELATATGLNVRTIGELERYGLIACRSLGDSVYYDEDALIAARHSAAFIAFGVEPRHLRMYKLAAEREVAVFEQLVLPILKQRNAETRQQALSTLNRLVDLGGRMRGAMVRQALREHLDPG